MLSQSPELIVIDEYPSNNKPFINPICRGTYDALPKIYGRKGKKKYLINIQSIITHQHTKLSRQCCHLEVKQQLRPSSDVNQTKRTDLHTEIAQPKSENCKKKSRFCNKSLQKQDEQRHQQYKQPPEKVTKLVLPQLAKDFEQIRQSQSLHKVYRSNNNPSVNNQKMVQSRFLMENRYSRLKQLKQSRLSRSEYVQTEPQSHLSSENIQTLQKNNKKQCVQSLQEKYIQQYGTSRSKLTYQSQFNYINKPYYQNLQNDPKLKHKSDRTQNSFHLIRHRHRSIKNQDDNLSISSFTIKNHQSVNTVFHQFKKKQKIRASNRFLQSKNKSQSVLSNGLFKIPQAEEYQSYLRKYSSINPQFNLKALIKKQNFHIVPTDKYVYFGQVVNQKKHGDGITVSEKEIYEGTYQNNLKIRGFEKNTDGIYSGQFLKGKRCGTGKFLWNNGEQFEGQWKDGKKNGFGIWKSPKGDFYEGQWKENRQYGKGYYVHHGGSKYRGYFKDFLKSGKGQQDFNNGDKYIGTYQLGKPHGYGKYIWANGDIYQGDFLDGSRQGKGTLRTTKGQVYDGEFKSDMKHGLGHQKYKYGQQFIGQFKEGERFKGKLKTNNGIEIEITTD